MKLIKIGRKVNPFAGIYFCMKALKENRIPELITSQLGERPKQAKFSFADNILGWLYCNFCGADRLEDAQHLKQYLEPTPGIHLPSSDSMGIVFKSFATESSTIISDTGRQHTFNINMKLNGLMIDIAKKLKQIQGDVLDYDNVIIPTEKLDATYTYKKTCGYQPGVAFMGHAPVYIEGRSGHTVASYNMAETLDRCFRLLQEKGIEVKRFRSDSAAYQKAIIEDLTTRGMDFFIRMNDSRTLHDMVLFHREWDSIKVGKADYEIAEMRYAPFGGETEYRIVITRIETQTGKPDKYGLGTCYNYRAIITNNEGMSKEEVLRFYNNRGKIERNFDELGNCFNWWNLPFSYLAENTVFMIIGSICHIIYKYIITRFSSKLDFLCPSFRLKKFITYFISVSGEWTGRTLKLYTESDYQLLE